MEIDSYLQDRLVHEYWTTPAENWLEYFMSHEKFEELLENSKENKELLARLATQFAEQAAITEGEERALQSKNFPLEDVQYYQRKCACLWLCSMACFAAIQWDYNYLLDTFDFLTVRPIVENVKKMFNDTELTSDATFGNWIWDKFCVAVAIRNRVPPPYPKPTVNNPLLKSSPDSVLLRFDANMKAIADLFILVFPAIKNLELQAKEGFTIYVPGWHCFFYPFREDAGKALNVGIIGQDVLVQGPPRPRLAAQVDLISTEDVANRARFDLAVFFFDDEKQIKTCADYVNAIKKSGSHPLISVDDMEVEGYRIALEITPAEVEMIPAEQLLDDDCDHRKFGLKRLQQLTEADERSQKAILIANLACDVVQQQPILIRHLISKDLEFFVHAAMARIPKLKTDLERRRVFSLLHYFCSTMIGFTKLLLNSPASVFPREWIREMVIPSPRITTPPPQKDIIQALITRSTPDPYWTIITSFNVTEIDQALKVLTRPIPPNPVHSFKVPIRFRYSEVLTEFLGSGNRAVVELNAILIGKASQLAKLHNFVEWEQYCNQLTPIFAAGTNSQRFVANIVIEAMHVRNCYYNQRIHTPSDSINADELKNQITTLRKIFVSLPCLSYPDVTKEALAFCLNMKEHEYILKLDFNYFLLTTTKILAAFSAITGRTEGVQEFLNAWCEHIRPFFESKSGKRGADQAVVREIAKNRTEFILFIKLIREPTSILFLISFFAHMFNSLLVADKKPHLKLFVQQSALFPAEFEIAHPHAEAITECLMAVLESGLETNPCNAFWTRTAADLKYVKGNIEEAAQLYIETVLACSPNGQPPFPENVINDQLWSRLRVCLNRMNYHTMAALACQLIKVGKTEEYAKAAACLINGISADPGAECLPMLFDLSLAEELSKVYDSQKQFNNLARLQYWSSKPALNPSNRPEIIAREQARRCELMMNSLAATVFETHI